MEAGLINIIERVGSLGLLGWLLVWATGTAWPKMCAHLDTVGAKLDRIGDQLTGLREEVNELRIEAVGVSPARPARKAKASKPNAGRAGATPTATGDLFATGSKA